MERWEIKWYLDEVLPPEQYKTRIGAVTAIKRFYSHQDVIIEWDIAKTVATVIYYNRVSAVIRKIEITEEEAIRIIKQEWEKKLEGLEIFFKCELCGEVTAQLVSCIGKWEKECTVCMNKDIKPVKFDDLSSLQKELRAKANERDEKLRK